MNLDPRIVSLVAGFFGALCAGVLTGVLAGRREAKALARAATAEAREFRKQIAALGRNLKDRDQELARKRRVADFGPLLVKRFTEELPVRGIASLAIRYTKELFDASRAGFFVRRDSSDRYYLLEGVGFPLEWEGRLSIPGDRGMLQAALRRQEVLIREDPKGSLVLYAQMEAGEDPPSPAVDFIAPVFVNGRPVAVLVAAGCAVPVERERELLSMLTELAGVAFRNATVLETIEQSATADDLTGLQNRLSFGSRTEKEIRRARNYGHPLSVFLFDVDHFKRINDTLGHPAGDQVLRKLAGIVRSVTRKTDLLARYGGEEFAVVMPSSGKEKAIRYAEMVRAKVEKTGISVNGSEGPVHVTISGGVASYPQDGSTVEELIAASDRALYRAKKRGRNRILGAESEPMLFTTEGGEGAPS